MPIFVGDSNGWLSTSYGTTVWWHGDHALPSTEIHRIAVFVDGSMELNADLDICLINPGGAALRATDVVQPLLDNRCAGQDPSVDCVVIGLKPTLAERLLQIR